MMVNQRWLVSLSRFVPMALKIICIEDFFFKILGGILSFTKLIYERNAPDFRRKFTFILKKNEKTTTRKKCCLLSLVGFFPVFSKGDFLYIKRRIFVLKWRKKRKLEIVNDESHTFLKLEK